MASMTASQPQRETQSAQKAGTRRREDSGITHPYSGVEPRSPNSGPEFPGSGVLSNDKSCSACTARELTAFRRSTNMAIGDLSSVTERYNSEVNDTMRAATTGRTFQRRLRTELRDLLDYANQFHHDTNPAWQTVTINDSELTHFSQRVMAFTRRR